ncbi:MAG: FAD-dependent oxidoreductase [Deltaproteobacteria bacterium]|nr:FAD-dependent oxidoreductase [Deltaproteobacteria bacterium]
MDHVTKHPSLWIETAPPLPRAPLHGDLSVDVCVVGAGITGITAARLLKRAGKTVAVIDARSVGGGETGHTTAHLASHHDLYYSDTIEKYGEDDARMILESRRAAIAQIESFVADENIVCAYERVPAYLFAEDGSGERDLREEIAACQRLGMNAEWVERVPAPFPVRGAIRFANQAQFHPLQYLAAMADRVDGNGSHVFEHTRALSIDSGAPCRVQTDRGTIDCRDVILATNSPVNAVGLLITRIAAYRTYAMAFRVDPASAPLALMWDTADPYHYIRVHHAGDATFLIVGAEDHKVGARENEAKADVQQDESTSAWRRIEGWTRGRFAASEIAAQWSGQILEPADGLPYVGKHDEHVWVATGFSGDGMTNGTMAAMLLSDEILDERSAIARLYDPKRLDLMASIKDYVRENVDFPMHLVSDRLKKAGTDRLRDVGPDEGKIVRFGKEKLAVFREASGEVHAFSPVCTHMGCLVHWNGAESSWDCPCHGSRFDARTGAALNGPAAKGLEARDVSDRESALPTVEASAHNVPRDTLTSFPARESRTSVV